MSCDSYENLSCINCYRDNVACDEVSQMEHKHYDNKDNATGGVSPTIDVMINESYNRHNAMDGQPPTIGVMNYGFESTHDKDNATYMITVPYAKDNIGDEISPTKYMMMNVYDEDNAIDNVTSTKHMMDQMMKIMLLLMWHLLKIVCSMNLLMKILIVCRLLKTL